MRSRLLPNNVRLRPAFTLIELLIVIALIIVIAGIGIIAIPLMQSQTRATQNASQIAAWLGNTKAMALRDQKPTGLRLVLDPNNPNWVNQAYIVQTPDDFTGGTLYSPIYLDSQVPPPTPLVLPNVVTFSNVDFTGGFANLVDWPVQAGDYLEISGGGLLYQIQAVTTNTLTVDRNVSFASFTTRYRVIRQPRRYQGQDTLTLTGSAEIDLSVSQNVPTRAVADVPPIAYEILFAPNGGVVGKGTVSSDKIMLWVRDTSKPNVTDNGPVLISIQVRTGFIGTYDVDMTSGDYYSFARDPHASGM